jgi:hypothetical protein
MKTFVMVLTVVGLLVAPALANQCPLLIKQIMDATEGQDGPGLAEGAALANEARALHEAGKHAESIRKAEDAAAAISLKLKIKK